ncbi:hypothetical protein PVK06_031690 [Gossypium arboreum]|uniref:Cytochrome P450 n=1 Tax=Gossypium arboreum TaxID=29729 RepID=A0ABR0NSS9_GOSAR|nr:hypothetical protein PVK06_031690 [Gossypium arboreum]
MAKQVLKGNKGMVTLLHKKSVVSKDFLFNSVAEVEGKRIQRLMTYNKLQKPVGLTIHSNNQSSISFFGKKEEDRIELKKGIGETFSLTDSWRFEMYWSSTKTVEEVAVEILVRGTIAFGRYGKHWRMRRRICPTGLMNRQTNEAARLLRKCIDDMIRYMEEDASGARTGGRRDLLNSGSKDGKEFFDAMNDVMVWAGKPNLADFLPVSKWLDPQGIKRNMVRDMGRALEIVSNFVKERVDELKLAE